MNGAIAAMLCTLIALTGFAYPRYPSADRAVGLVGGDPGRTTVEARVSRAGLSAAVGRSVTRRLEVIGAVVAGGGLSLTARVAVVRDLGPLHLALDFGTAGTASFGATLTLGPIRIDAIRTWGSAPGRSLTLSLSSSPGFSLRLGVTDGPGDGARPTIGVSAHWAGFGLWGASAAVECDGSELAFGGTW